MENEEKPYIKEIAPNQWEIDTGESILNCNAAGKDMFLKALEKEGLKSLPKTRNRGKFMSDKNYIDGTRRK